MSDDAASTPFEGPEKLLEIWFAPSPADCPDALESSSDGRYGLRRVDRKVWEEMLDIVQCKVLSVVHGREMDAYLLSESSLFISPHRLILKTCGTTLNLLGLPRILAIARDQAGLPNVHRCFYSRKSFMFPERQLGPHRGWTDEVQYLDNIFNDDPKFKRVQSSDEAASGILDTSTERAAGDYGTGAAYNIGKVNGDHWLLYLTIPPTDNLGSTSELPPVQLPPTTSGSPVDSTIEILMSNLAPEARSVFYPEDGIFDSAEVTPSAHAQALSRSIGISSLFPEHLTNLDAYTFSPCGYSANALLKWGSKAASEEPPSEGQPSGGEGYYTIHVTPEEGWSYASFECNVPLPHTYKAGDASLADGFPDLKTLIQRVVSIFKPGRLTLTLFVSDEANSNNAEEEEGETAVEAAQRVFKSALMTAPAAAGANGNGACAPQQYRRTDKINYEFGGYDLAFASFELRR